MNSKILVIEDNLNLQKLIEKSLEKDFVIKTSDSAEDAYNLICEHDFFCVIVDLNLPGMNGYEFITELTSNESAQKPYIIMISAKNTEVTKLTAINLGAISFIEKPFDIRYLRGVVKNLEKHTSTSTNEIICGDLKVNFEKNEITLENEIIFLTEAERNILKELIKNNSEEVTRERLYLISGCHQTDTNYRVIDTHISSLRKKLSTSRVQLKSIYGKGYKLIT